MFSLSSCVMGLVRLYSPMRFSLCASCSGDNFTGLPRLVRDSFARISGLTLRCFARSDAALRSSGVNTLFFCATLMFFRAAADKTRPLRPALIFAFCSGVSFLPLILRSIFALRSSSHGTPKVFPAVGLLLYSGRIWSKNCCSYHRSIDGAQVIKGSNTKLLAPCLFHADCKCLEWCLLRLRLLLCLPHLVLNFFALPTYTLPLTRFRIW